MQEKEGELSFQAGLGSRPSEQECGGTRRGGEGVPVNEDLFPNPVRTHRRLRLVASGHRCVQLRDHSLESSSL